MSATPENWQSLPKTTKDLERARESMIEEFQAINWYQQRIDATDDPELRHILEHNRTEEKEHAALLFEYIKSKDLGQATALEESDLAEG